MICQKCGVDPDKQTSGHCACSLIQDILIRINDDPRSYLLRIDTFGRLIAMCPSCGIGWRFRMDEQGRPTEIEYEKPIISVDKVTNLYAKTLQTLIIASREYLYHDGKCDKQNKMSDAYRDELKTAIEEAYKFVTGNEYEWKDSK